MRIREIYYTNKFVRKIKTIPKALKKAARAREQLFKNNCFDPTLKTHSFHGKPNRYAFWVTHAHLIIFKITGNGAVTMIDIANASIYE